MEKIKLKLSNEEFKVIFIRLTPLSDSNTVLTIDRMIIREVLEMIYEKNYKPVIKITLFHSQSFVIFKFLTEISNRNDLSYYEEVVLNTATRQIEEQLFKKSDTGFEALKQNTL